MTPGLLDLDRKKALELLPVSRETEQRLDVLVEQIIRWQPVKNLVSNHALPELWTRHVVDSLQLSHLAPNARRWLDLGSGAGFPGLVIAALRQHDPAFHIDLIESNGRKCAFMRETARLMDIRAHIHHARIEDAMEGFAGKVDLVSARALAPLAKLMELSGHLLTSGAEALFPKGKDVGHELTETAKYWRLDYRIHNSLTDPAAKIVHIKHAERLAHKALDHCPQVEK